MATIATDVSGRQGLIDVEPAAAPPGFGNFKPRPGRPGAFFESKPRASRNLAAAQAPVRPERPQVLTGKPARKPGVTVAAGTGELPTVHPDYVPPASLLMRPALGLEQLIDFHREQVRLADYTIIGRMKAVVFGEPARGAPTPPRDQTRIWGIRLDWRDQGPLLALSKDGQGILITDLFRHPPKVVHPAWTPKHGAFYEHVMTDGTRANEFTAEHRQQGLSVKRSILHAADVPGPEDMIEQLYEERSCVAWPSGEAIDAGQGYAVFSPIAQVMFQNSQGYGYIHGKTDHFNGSKFSLLINPRARRQKGGQNPVYLEEGFFVRGRFEIRQGPEVILG
jgi:hypothetical protein